MPRYLKVVFVEDEENDEYLEWCKNLIMEDYFQGGFDGVIPTITIEDDDE